MIVEVIEWIGMKVGQQLELSDDYSELLIEQGKVKKVDVKISKRSRNKSGDSDFGGSEGLVESAENA